MVAESIVEAEVVEVLIGFGLAHVRTAEDMVYGLTRRTPGIEFDTLRVGQLVRCRVTASLHKVVHAELLKA